MPPIILCSPMATRMVAYLAMPHLTALDISYMFHCPVSSSCAPCAVFSLLLLPFAVYYPFPPPAPTPCCSSVACALSPSLRSLPLLLPIAIFTLSALCSVPLTAHCSFHPHCPVQFPLSLPTLAVCHAYCPLQFFLFLPCAVYPFYCPLLIFLSPPCAVDHFHCPLQFSLHCPMQFTPLTALCS